MKLGIASDHRGFKLKQNLTNKLKEKGYTIIDYGTNSTKRTDYQKFGFLLGEAIRDKKIEYGIALCGSAIGISIACNKVKKVRCGKVDSLEDVIHGKECDFINCIAINGATDINLALEMIELLINTKYKDDDVYLNRIKEIEKYEYTIN
ncbi:MAG: RpiB/LacA/LacB family sugar-phosphate isomerase [Bacilli bacterium]